MSDLIYFLGKPILIITLSFVVLEFFSLKKIIPIFYLRKKLHVIAVSICAFVISKGMYLDILQWIFFFAAIFLFLLLKFSKIKLDFGNSYGICLFPFAFFVVLFFDKAHFSAIAVSGYVLAFADAFAGIIGYKFGKRKFKFLNEEKSIIGFITFSVFTFGILQIFTELSMVYLLISALMIGISEIFSYKGSDNFTIIVFGHIWLSFMPMVQNISMFYCIASIVFLGLGSWFIMRKNWLDYSGLIAAGFIGIISLLSLGVKGLYAPMYLLIMGSLMHKIFGKNNGGEKRNARQVFANGLPGSLFYLLFIITQNTCWLVLALTSFGISICDTLSSETGRAFKGRVIDIISFKKVAAGISGGISFHGSLGGIMGVLLYVLIANQIFELKFSNTIFILGFSVIGMLTDSVIGSKYQPLYIKDSCYFENEITGSTMVKGLKWMSNDMVNFISNLTVTLFCYLILFR